MRQQTCVDVSIDLTMLQAPGPVGIAFGNTVALHCKNPPMQDGLLGQSIGHIP